MDSEIRQTIQRLITELTQLYEETHAPFPYSGCRKLLSEAGQHGEDLISDLDMYFSELAGYCSWGERILKWPREKIRHVCLRASRTFFEKHPQYEHLSPWINETNSPDLHSRLILYERMRNKLLELLSLLQSQ